MYVVLVNESHELITTKRQRVMQYSNLVDTFQLLIPPIYEGKDLTTAEILLEYYLPITRTYRTELLKKSDELYKNHLEYKLPFDTQLTTEPGDIEVWATIKLMETEPDGDLHQWVRKTSSTMISIELAPGQGTPSTDDVLMQKIENLEAKMGNYVSYVERQSLTDDEKSLIRANIGVGGYNFYPYKSLFADSSPCGWIANAIDKWQIEDMKGMTALKSTEHSSLSLIGVLISAMNRVLQYSVHSDTPEKQEGIIKNELMPQILKLIESRIWKPIEDTEQYLWRFIVCSDVNNPITYRTYHISYMDDYLGIDLNTIHGGSSVQYNNGIFAVNQVLPRYDTTLSYSGTAADSKTVGDILRQQADWTQADETAYDYIKNKPTKDDALELVAEMGLVDPAVDENGAIYIDVNGAIYVL